MATQTVKYTSPIQLNCAACLPADVILCVPVSIDANATLASESGIIEATITFASRAGGYWTYTLEYDDDQLVDGVTLTAAMIQGIVCRGCLFSYIDYRLNYNEATGPAPGTSSLGEELITNGNFDTDLAGWTGGPDWIWSAGTALHVVGNTTALSQNIEVESGETYFITYTTSGAMSGSSAIYVDGVLIPTYNYIEIDDPGINRASFTATVTGTVLFEVRPSLLFDSAYDAISIRQVIDLSRAIFTLIDADGDELAAFRGVDSQDNLGIGLNALLYTLNDSFLSFGVASRNLAIGKEAMMFNTSGYENVAVGQYALRANTSGNVNVAVGYEALKTNTAGQNNTAVGAYALNLNDGGFYNTAIGYGALAENTFGISNVAVGVNALYHATTSNYNVAIGSNVLGAIGYSGSHNIGVGIDTLRSVTTAQYCQAFGHEVLYSFTAGTYNDGYGHQVLHSLTTGSFNIAIGGQALSGLVTGDRNIVIGSQAAVSQTAGSGNIMIASNANFSSPTGSDQLNIGGQIFGDLFNGLFGLGVTVPGAVLHLKAGAASSGFAPLRFSDGVNLTVPATGVVEYSSGRFAVTESDLARRFLVQAAASTKVIAGAPYANDGYVTMTINGTDVRIMTTLG